jgi:hypothetical protein
MADDLLQTAKKDCTARFPELKLEDIRARFSAPVRWLDVQFGGAISDTVGRKEILQRRQDFKACLYGTIEREHQRIWREAALEEMKRRGGSAQEGTGSKSSVGPQGGLTEKMVEPIVPKLVESSIVPSRLPSELPPKVSPKPK